ncbi:DMT family transporter [Rhizobiales bacterium]|uniref:DMT family transporter n=1 Tax=Hongsoonwoonella zoysiae TaxID=2821844 RepID=UPI00155FF6A6|nr:DMT family transporter [Hongsoonwoonella zoysiae]NRG18169.1 DMT family transporter [Hongsoonwoonella zoysiae]
MNRRITHLATAIVVFTGALWGLYWLPVRSLAEAGLPGAWGTVVITAAATLMLSPLAFLRRRQFARTNRVALASIALGGAAFALYSIGFVYGRVAIIILLYFLTPVWSTLIGRYVMGWHTPRMRVLAILVGLAGLAVMLGADGELPVPRGTGEWMALISGILWSVATTGMRAKSDLEPVAAAFVFALGATVLALLLAPLLKPLPGALPGEGLLASLGLAFATGGIWWGLSVGGLMWATVRLEPARVGILLMTEVVVGVVSAAALAAEHLDPLEIAGGALVLCAGLLEVWPTRSAAAGRSGLDPK